MAPAEVEGFLIFRIALKPLPAFPHAATHYLYLRPDDPKIPIDSTPRSLFLVNVPIDATELHFRHLFSTQLGLPLGRVEDVIFEHELGKWIGSLDEKRDSATRDSTAHRIQGSKMKRDANPNDPDQLPEAQWPRVWDRYLHKSGSNATVVFVDKPSMEAVLKAVKKSQKKEIIWGESIEDQLPPLGPQRYLTHQKMRFPDQSELMRSIDTYMTAYGAREAAEEERRKELKAVPDEDGFITVTRGGRTGAASQEGAQALAAKHKAREKNPDDFYRFQTRERQKARANELIKKFEEDKDKVRKMRERRGSFKPE